MRWVVVLVNLPAKLDRPLEISLVDAIEGRSNDRLQVRRTLIRLPVYVNSKYFASGMPQDWPAKLSDSGGQFLSLRLNSKTALQLSLIW